MWTLLLIALASIAAAQDAPLPPSNLTNLCAAHPDEAGFFCVPGQPNEFLRCDVEEHVAQLMPCPAGTVCVAPLLVFTTASPCGTARGPVCGNGLIEEGEECEIGGTGCGSNCQCLAGFFPSSPVSKDCVVKQICGNGVVESGEECEIGGFGCDQQCKCSPGFVASSPASRDCVSLPACGNGVLESGEECETGGIGCTTGCKCSAGFVPKSPPERDCAIPAAIPFCGDGKVDVSIGEQCEIGGVGCTSSCKCLAGFTVASPVAKDCIPPTILCGNGVIDTGEQCEIGGLGCNSSCKCIGGLIPATPVAKDCVLPPPVCGNGQLEVGEQCEANGIGCVNCICQAGFVAAVPVAKDCVALPKCGNGVIDLGEQCEIGGFGCMANCLCSPAFQAQTPPAKDCAIRPACGNGVVESGEQCEIGGSGCGANCLCVAGFDVATPPARDCIFRQIVPSCGNGIVEGSEQCEIGGFGCSSTCSCIAPFFVPRVPPAVSCSFIGPVCGDSIVEAGEECEIGGAGCGANCLCASGFSPAVPAARDCIVIPAAVPVTNLTALCTQIDSGFICLPGSPTQYLRCHLMEKVAFMMNCPLGTVCSVATLVPTINAPCTTAPVTPEVPATLLPPVCGNGEINSGEQCEIGGVGCGADCQCLAGFIPQLPIATSCVPIVNASNLNLICAAAGADGFFCPTFVPGAGNNHQFVQCFKGTSIVFSCPPGTECNALGFGTANPCNFSTGICGNGILEGSEQCEITGEGCNPATCQCLPGFVPAIPAALDCVPQFIAGSSINASNVCLAFNATGFFCPNQLFPGTNVSNATFGQCVNGSLAGFQDCAFPLECVAPNVTQDNPCALVPRCGDGIVNASIGEQCEASGRGCNASTCQCFVGFAPASPPSVDCVQLFAPVCGNGVLEVNETCEAQGVGCNATTCQCLANFTRQFPAQKDCVPLPAPLAVGGNATALCIEIGAGLPAFGVCISGVEGSFLLCDASAGSSTLLQCPPGTTCTAPLLAPMPCTVPSK